MNTLKRSILSLLSGSCLLVPTTSTLQAQDYQFAETCAPTTLYQSKGNAPDALIILDRSGSMDEQGGDGKTKIEIARSTIKELADATYRSGTCSMADASGCDSVRLGLGYFRDDKSEVSVTPAEDRRATIKSTVDTYGADGGTPTGLAAKSVYQSNELRNAERLGIGVIISDGQPSVGSGTPTRDTIEQGLYYLCKARQDYDIRTFSVGFGSGSDPRMNSLLAAAGGTGRCCKNPATDVACTYQPSEIYDPCAKLAQRTNTTNQLNATGSSPAVIVPYNVYTYYPGYGVVTTTLYKLNTSKYTCEGSIEASTGQALKTALLKIIGDLACTFPLDIPTDYLRYPGADADPAATRVEVSHTSFGPGKTRIPQLDTADPNAFYRYLRDVKLVADSVASQYKGEGWSFVDAQRTTVTLTPKLCADFNASTLRSVETQVACLCPRTGDLCNVVCHDTNADGYDDTTGAACAEICDDVDSDGKDDATGVACNSAAKIDAQLGRCRIGTIACDYGVERCAPQYTKQPEVCNGLDDDCDGELDNLEHANPARDADDPEDSSGREYFEWNKNSSQLAAYDLEEGVFCGFASVCRCEKAHTLSTPPGPSAMATDAEWLLLLQSTGAQKQLCECAAALEYDNAAQDGVMLDDSLESEHDAAVCTISTPLHGRSPSAPLGTLIALGALTLLGVTRRRSSHD